MSSGQGKFKIAILASHTTQHEGPLFRRINQHPLMELVVYFYSNMEGSQPGRRRDPEVGYLPDWDIPVLEGYRYKFIPRMSLRNYIRDLVNQRYHAIVVEGYNSLYSWLTMLVARVVKTPILFRCDTTLLYGNSLPKRLIKRQILRTIFRIASAYLPVGTLNIEFYKAHGISQEKLFLVPYAVDNERISKQTDFFRERRNELKRQLGIPEDVPVILGVLKFVEREAPMDLVRAYASICRKGFKSALVLVGDGEQRTVLQEYIQRNHLDNVHLVGYKPYSELPKFYAIADVFVHPAIRGPWELSINEAAAAGLPIVTTNLVGSATDLVKNGSNGFIYHAGDVEELAARLEVILKDRKLMVKMGQESRRIVSQWGYKQCVEGFLEAVEYVAQRKEMI